MKLIYIVGIVAILIVGAFFIFSNNNQSDSNIENIEESEIVVGWRNTELTDIRTGEKFKISQFDKPIVLESFAVWCPTCTQQQIQVRELHEEIGDAFISISLDTDPNEDREQVLEHIERNGFNWFYVISPREMTEDLIDEFGIGFVNAPRAPVVIIDENKDVRLLRSGVKSASELKTELGL